MHAVAPRDIAYSWLLLVHQIPAQPAYLRVKIWRRLQSLGAVAVKNAVHALPMNDGTVESFEWLLREIVDGGGDAFLCEARVIDGLSDEQVRNLFDQARNADYREIAKDTRELGKRARHKQKGEDALAELRLKTARLRKRLSEVAAVDFFGAVGRDVAETLLADIESRLSEDDEAMSKDQTPGPRTEHGTLRGRTWVTRKGVYIDRIGSAWLIRRFIDPNATFKFVSGKGYRPDEGELRFDMYQGEFTHEGDKCTFEVLLDRLSLREAPLRAIAEIVHDIDLTDDKFGRAEAAGVRALIDGIALTSDDDTERLQRGGEVFNNLYEVFAKKRR